MVKEVKNLKEFQKSSKNLRVRIYFVRVVRTE